MLLSLDWAKAFDSVSPEALLRALERFGVPPKFAAVVSSIYANRRFAVKDAGSTSELWDQAVGICQGCPLSPFLFSIVMTVLIYDAKGGTDRINTALLIDELMYADDTLVVSVDALQAESFMRKIQDAGKNYGLSFN